MTHATKFIDTIITELQPYYGSELQRRTNSTPNDLQNAYYIEQDIISTADGKDLMLFNEVLLPSAASIHVFDDPAWESAKRHYREIQSELLKSMHLAEEAKGLTIYFGSLKGRIEDAMRQIAADFSNGTDMRHVVLESTIWGRGPAKGKIGDAYTLYKDDGSMSLDHARPLVTTAVIGPAKTETSHRLLYTVAEGLGGEFPCGSVADLVRDRLFSAANDYVRKGTYPRTPAVLFGEGPAEKADAIRYRRIA
ncbi:hypothetical protein JXB02_05565 [Candidatus Woesearchaeota archaeon]|nr:hypothetical protein [Candidatus Woesearchaeota archaeon]